MKKLFCLAIILGLIGSAALAADFQRSARGGGLGFSYFLLADEPSGALYNPSALGFIKGWQTQFMYEKQADYDYKPASENPYYGQFGVVYYRPNIGTFSLNSVQSGSFSNLTNIATVNHAVLSYGRQLGGFWSAGGSFKYLSESGFGKRSAVDADAAVSFRTNFGLIAAAAFENIARSQLTPEYQGIKENLPRRSRLGAGYLFTGNDFQASFLLGGQIEEWGISQKYTTTLANLGTEWWFMQQNQFSFGARGGYTIGEADRFDTKTDYASPSAGLSFNYRIGFNDLRLDYSWQAYPFETTDGSTPANHFLAVSFGWGGVPNYPSKPKDDFQKKPEPKADPDATKPQIFKTQPSIDTEAPLVDKDTDFEKSNYMQFNVQMDVSDISSMNLKRIVFYVRPQQVIKTISWKLFVFKAKIKSWSPEEASRWAIGVVEGKGVPPINIIWDGLDTNGQFVPKGRYFYLLTAIDLKGQNYATEWFNFKLE